MRRLVGGLPVSLLLSILLHGVALASLAQAVRRPTPARGGFTRVRVVQWHPRTATPRQLQVSLPGVRLRPTPLTAADPQAPSPEELQQQMERITALRTAFFQPMRLQTLPMPVLPLPPDLPLPPLWDAPLPGGPLPAPDTEPEEEDERQQLARLLHGPASTAATTPQPELSPPKAAADLLANQPALAASALALSSDPATAPDAALQNEEKSAEAEAKDAPGTEVAAANTPEAIASPPAVSEPHEGTDPPASEAEAAAPAETGSETEAPADPPSGTEATPVAVEPAGDTVAKETKGNVLDAPASGEPAVATTPAHESPANAEEPAEAQPPPTPRLVANGPHAGVRGAYRVPLGLALPGFRSSASMVALVREVNARTGLRLLPNQEASPENLGASMPLLYLKGTGKLAFSAAQRAALKAYVEGGGTILVDGATDEFGDQVRAELDHIFGKAPVSLPASHPLYTACYRLPGAPGVKFFPLQAIEVGGRPAVLLSAAFLGRRWQSTRDPEHEAAVALGVNVVVYTIANRK